MLKLLNPLDVMMVFTMIYQFRLIQKQLQCTKELQKKSTHTCMFGNLELTATIAMVVTGQNL